MRALLTRLLIPVLVLCGTVPVVQADRPAPPRDYLVATDDKQYVFVMLAPDNGPSRRDPDMRDKYPRSGMYRNDGSTTPIWTVDWYQQEITPLDAIHLIRWGPWASTINDLAVSFYAQGEELNHYHIRELIHDESRLDWSVSHFTWLADWNYDHRHRTLSLETKDGRSWQFLVTTGEILTSATVKE